MSRTGLDRATMREAIASDQASKVAENPQSGESSTVTEQSNERTIEHIHSGKDAVEVPKEKETKVTEDSKSEPGQEDKPKEAPKGYSKNDLRFKADGKEVEAKSIDQLKEYASYGYHASQKLRDAKLKEMQMDNLMNDPEALLTQLQNRGYDVSQYMKKFAQKEEPEDYGEIPIDSEFDTEGEKLLKQTLNDLKKKVSFQDRILGKLHSNYETSNWMMEFKKTQDQYLSQGYAIPENAAMNISALMQILQNQHGNKYSTSQYMQGAFQEYLKSLPNYELTEDAIKGNASLYDKIKRDIIAEYNAADDKRRGEAKVPKTAGKLPTIEDNEEEPTGPMSLRARMKHMNEKMLKKMRS